jgi:hypothetical protein
LEEKDPSDLLEQQPKSPNPPIKQSSWKKLSLWSLVFAVCSLVIAFHEVIPDIIEYLTRFDIRARCYLSNFFSLVFYVVGLNFLRIKFITKHPLIGKFFLLLGAILTAFGPYLFAKVIDLKAERYSHLVFLAAAIYGSVGYADRSRILWSLALLLLGVGFGIEVTYYEGRYVFVMPEPYKFVFLGLILILLSFVFDIYRQLQTFISQTCICGVFYFLMALLILSTQGTAQERCYSLACFSVLFYAIGLNAARIKFISNHPSGRRIPLFLGSICAILSLLQFGRITELQIYNLIFLAAAIYGGVGYMGRSKTLWSSALLFLGIGLGLRWTYSNGDYIFGISKPCNFVLLGLLLIFLFSIFNFHKQTQIFAKSTLFFGLFYLFMALWSLSICGTHDSNSNSDLLFFGIVFGGVALLSLYLGIKYDIVLAQWFGGIFFYINLLTKYFEHFWNSYHKSIFFAILGLFFLIITLTVGKFSQISSKLKKFSSRCKKRSKE